MRRLLSGGLVLLLLAGGCAGREAPPEPAGESPAPPPAPASPADAPASPAGPEGALSPSAPESAPAVGAQAPDFTLPGIRPGGEAGEFRLAEAKGPVVVLFYPQAMTPGCTEELCGFRDRHAPFAKAGATVVAISADSPESLREFARSEGFPFFLASDPQGKVASQYGSWGGDEARRTMFVLGPDHRIVHRQMAFDLDKLPEEISAALKAAGAAD